MKNYLIFLLSAVSGQDLKFVEDHTCDGVDPTAEPLSAKEPYFDNRKGLDSEECMAECISYFAELPPDGKDKCCIRVFVLKWGVELSACGLYDFDGIVPFDVREKDGDILSAKAQIIPFQDLEVLKEDNATT